ncbi:MAG TPA: hypothetical protein VF553_19610 [Pyrinomonadaceae bacterium]|jgi:hypothetical protein
MSTISEQEFKKLCADIYADRFQIYAYNPNVSRKEALLWMMLGCLVSLLSIPILEQPSAYGGASEDPYGDAILEVLKARMEPDFDPQAYLDELSRKIEAEQKS